MSRPFRRAPQDSQILLGDAVLRHGGGELAGDLPAAGEQHDAAHRLIETVDGGDVIVLTQGAVMLPQQGGHTGGSVGAVLGQNTHGLDAEDKEFVLVQDTAASSMASSVAAATVGVLAVVLAGPFP